MPHMMQPHSPSAEVLEGTSASTLPMNDASTDGLRTNARENFVRAGNTSSDGPDRKLKAFESQLSAILNNTIDDVWSIDRDYRLLSFNAAFVKTMKASGADIYPGYDVLQTDLPEIYITFWREMYDRTLAGERFILEKPAFYDPMVYFELSFNPIYTDGEITGAAVQRRAISERKRAEREVLSSKAYLQSLLNSTGDAIWSLDRDRKIVWMNEQMQRTVQLAYGETVEVGSRPIPIVGEIEALRWDAWFDAAFAGDVVRTIYEVPNGDSPLTFDVRFNPVRINDEIDGVVVVARDITAEKRIEQQLIEQRDKAEQMNKLKSSFLANMSHEIRTPLTSIIGYADLLCAELKEREHAKYATSIEQSGRRLLTTINEILDLAKIQAGTMQPELKHASIDTSIENVVTMLMPIARANRLWLQYQPSQAPLHAMTDTQLLERVLVNVIGNALKFTEEGGVYIQLELMQGSFLIRVSDTGIGIDPEFLPFVFDEFKQQSVGYNRKYEGTGLGLTITRKLMCLLGGSITIKETSPRGTIFELSFPLYTEATPPSIHS